MWQTTVIDGSRFPFKICDKVDFDTPDSLDRSDRLIPLLQRLSASLEAINETYFELNPQPNLNSHHDYISNTPECFFVQQIVSQ